MKSKTNNNKPAPEKPAFMNLMDEVLQHKIRLGACILLSEEGSITFTSLKKALEATDGNLGAQLRKLEEVGYVTMKKEFMERKPVTRYSLSKKGKNALNTHMEGMISAIEQVKGESPTPPRDEEPKQPDSKSKKQKEKPSDKPADEKPAKKEKDPGPSLFDL